jgi:hypothetical protein
MRGRAWIIPVALGLIVVVLVLVVPNQPSSSPDHRSDSDAPDGTSALYEYASRLGHPTARQKGSFNLPDKPGILFVFSPDDPYDQSQARQLAQWVRDGGTLVYADAAIDERLAAEFRVTASESYISGPGADSGSRQVTLTAPVPLLDGVSTLVSAPEVAETYAPTTGQVAVLRVGLGSRGGADRVVGILAHEGKGRAFFLGDPILLCNGYLGKADNGRLAADLLAMAPAYAPVRFDEFHHGAGGTSASINDWVTTPWGIALAWALVVIFVGFFVRGRSFGPPIPILSTRDRSSAEYATAVGTLLRRARARDLTLKVIADATRRTLAERTGLGRGVPADRMASVLRQRAPQLAADLGEADAMAPTVSGSESQLLKAARKLHALAYPSAKSK